MQCPVVVWNQSIWALHKHEFTVTGANYYKDHQSSNGVFNTEDIHNRHITLVVNLLFVAIKLCCVNYRMHFNTSRATEIFTSTHYVTSIIIISRSLL